MKVEATFDGRPENSSNRKVPFRLPILNTSLNVVICLQVKQR